MNNKLFEQLIEEIPTEVKIFVSMYETISMRVYEILEAKGMSQKDLAELLDKRPSEISKWLNDGHNLTLKTIAKLESALGESIIKIPLRTVKEFFSEETIIKGHHSFTVYRNDDKKHLQFEASKFTPTLSIRKKIA